MESGTFIKQMKYTLSIVLFRRYSVNNILQVLVINLAKPLGSQINNFYPHQGGGNQRIEIKGANSAFRIGYKYGFVNGHYLIQIFSY
jgi:hypothetical protein